MSGDIMKRIVVVLASVMLLPLAQAMAFDAIRAQQDFTESYKQEAAGNLIGAITVTRETLKREPKYYDAMVRLGYLYNLSGAFTDAEEAYHKAIAIKSMAIEPQLGLMQVLGNKGKWDDVIKVGQSVLKIDPNQYTAISRMAWAFYSKGDFNEAQKRYNQILTLYPADIEMKLGLGWAHLKGGNKKEAERLFEEVLIVSPGNPRGLAGWNQIKGKGK